MAKDKRKTYIASWEPEYWQYSQDGKGVICPASEAPDPIMRTAVNGKYYKLISMNDGSFEKI